VRTHAPQRALNDVGYGRVWSCPHAMRPRMATYPGIHEEMLKDSVRTKTYQQAIYNVCGVADPARQTNTRQLMHASACLHAE
jgi:hypothetical protein